MFSNGKVKKGKGPKRKEKKERSFKAKPPQVPGWALDFAQKDLKRRPSGRIDPGYERPTLL